MKLDHVTLESIYEIHIFILDLSYNDFQNFPLSNTLQFLKHREFISMHLENILMQNDHGLMKSSLSSSQQSMWAFNSRNSIYIKCITWLWLRMKFQGRGCINAPALLENKCANAAWCFSLTFSPLCLLIIAFSNYFSCTLF